MRREGESVECTLLPTQGIFNLGHHIGIIYEELAFDDAVAAYAVQYAKRVVLLKCGAEHNMSCRPPTASLLS